MPRSRPAAPTAPRLATPRRAALPPASPPTSITQQVSQRIARAGAKQAARVYTPFDFLDLARPTPWAWR